jgi:hypothetical protein
MKQQLTTRCSLGLPPPGAGREQALAKLVWPRKIDFHEPVPAPKRKPVLPDTVTPSTMLRLVAAARIAFPDGSISVGAMRRLAADGLLTIYEIRGKQFTTLDNIEEMKIKCRVQAKDRDSSFSKPKAAPECGISATGNKPTALDALKANAHKLIENLPNTSSASTIRKPAGAEVIPIKSK